MALSSTSNLTPWLAPACLTYLQNSKAANNNQKPKLVQILSRGGNFWSTRKCEGDAWLVVTDGKYAVVAYLTLALRRQLLDNDVFSNYARHCVGLLPNVQWKILPGGSSTPSQATILVGEWICKPGLNGMIVAAMAMIQPLSEDITIRRALNERKQMLQQRQQQEQQPQQPPPPVVLGNAQEVLEDPLLLEELLKMASSGWEDDDEDDDDMAEDDDDEEVEDEEKGTPGKTPATQQEQDTDNDDDDYEMNLKDMLQTQEEFSQTYQGGILLTQPFDAPADREHEPSQEYSETYLLTQPTSTMNMRPPPNHRPHQDLSPQPSDQPPPVAPPANSTNTISSIVLVEACTQTENHRDGLLLLLDRKDPTTADITSLPATPTKKLVTARDVTSVTSNLSTSSLKRPRRTWRAGDTDDADQDSLSTDMAASFTATTTAIHDESASFSSCWDQIKEQLDSDDPTMTVITCKVDPRMRHPLRKGDLARWLHKNVVVMSHEHPQHHETSSIWR